MKNKCIVLLCLFSFALVGCGVEETCEPVEAECVDGLTYEACCTSGEDEDCYYIFSDETKVLTEDSIEESALEAANYCLGN